MAMTFFDDLSGSSSPYLREHAPSLVKWHTWSLKPLQEAANTGKPLFISMGFASSYMCKKMNKECFLDEQVAKKLNDDFICIKIDKDESSLIHHYLIHFAKILIPEGLTWPVNLFLTPDLKPFFGISFLPKTSTEQQGGLLDILDEVTTLYKEEGATVQAQGEKMVHFYTSEVLPLTSLLPTTQDRRAAAEKIFAIADPLHAGIQNLYKFPLSYQAHFLIKYGKTHQDGRAFFLMNETFEKMRLSAISDKLYGGYFSFTHDEAWEKPYFEKTLALNAYVGRALVAFIKETKQAQSEKELRSLLSFMQGSLKIEGEGFASTEYSLDEEKLGESYKLSSDYISQKLSDEDLDLFLSYFSIAYTGTAEGGSLLSCSNSIEQWSEEAGEDPEMVEGSIKASLTTLRKSMRHDKPAQLDKRQFLGGSANAALLFYEAGKLLDESSYLETCEQVVNFLDTHFAKEDFCYHYFSEGSCHHLAELEDLASYLHTLLKLYEYEAKPIYKERATQLLKVIDNHFYQGKNGLFFSKNTPLSLEVPIFFEDVSAPSAQAIHAHNLLLMAQIYDEPSYLDQGLRVINCLNEKAQENPWAYTYLLYVQMLYADYASN